MHSVDCSFDEKRPCVPEKAVNVILMAVVPILLCGNNDKNRQSLWSKERCMDRNIYSDIHLHKLVSTKDDNEKHSGMGNKTLISLIHKPSL
jgi:hypothetical protein